MVSILVLVDLAREWGPHLYVPCIIRVSILVLVDLAREYWSLIFHTRDIHLVSILVLVDLARECFLSPIASPNDSFQSLF